MTCLVEERWVYLVTFNSLKSENVRGGEFFEFYCVLKLYNLRHDSLLILPLPVASSVSDFNVCHGAAT